MARQRQHGEELSVAEWHRNHLPELYVRRGHRLDMANRDWTEFCHFCKETLAVWEDVIDRGQDLRDKGTSVTRRMAERADVQALYVAARIDRPADVQRCINELHREIRRLEALHPIQYFTVRRLHPNPGTFVRLTPDEFAAEIYLLHREHHLVCQSAQHHDPVYKTAELRAAKAMSRIWAHPQMRLEYPA